MSCGILKRKHGGDIENVEC